MSFIKSFYGRLPGFIQWLLWCAAALTISFILNEFLNFKDLHWLALLALGTAGFLFFERPLILFGLPETFETAIVVLLSMGFIGHLGWVYVAPQLEKEKLYSQACHPDSLEMKCYLFSRENCLSVWTQYSQICTVEVKENLAPSRVTALIGPTVKLCTYKKFDHSFNSTRRIEPSAECIEHFRKMDEPSL